MVKLSALSSLKEDLFKRFINCADTVKFYVFQGVRSPVLPEICQYLVKIKLATVKTADSQTSITEHNEAIRLTFAHVKQLPACLCDTPIAMSSAGSTFA